jgi:hypothetical protein
LTLAFALAAAAVIGAGSLIYLRVLTAQLHTTIDAELTARALSLRPALESAPIDTLTATVARQSEGGQLTQVLGPDGSLLASSSAAGARPLLRAAELAPVPGRPRTFDAHVSGRVAHDVDSTQVRVLAGPVPLADGRGVLLVATSLRPTNDALDRITDVTAWAGSFAVLLAGLAGWLLATAALRPVERMRRQAAALSADDSTSGIAEVRTHDEIAALSRTMNDLLGRLRGALERERSFVADAGHELRTPLAILRTELELAHRPGRSADELRAAVGHAAEEADRLGRLANDLLVLATGNPSGTMVQRQPTEVAELVERSVETARRAASPTGVSLVVDVPVDLVADIDAQRVGRLLSNLLDNSVRHTPRGGTVTVTVVADADRLGLSVRDSGPGFPPEFLPSAFERFSRADAARTRRSGGAGLGLAIVRTIAEAHGGSAVAANGAEGGAVVTVELAAAVLTTARGVA